MTTIPPTFRVDFYPFRERKLEDILKLQPPPFLGRGAFTQLEYLSEYIGRADFNCESIAIERHYIDRDYMEDYSVFYSRNHHEYKNWCQRVHFFSTSVEQLRAELRATVQTGYTEGLAAYRQACENFSDRFYLGFTVIKPLSGCPVGRTVLRPYKEAASPGVSYDFTCTKWYQTHLAGVRLSVKGLAFQQQDVGVSACATTALWSAMQKVRDLEDIAAATPAQITRLASQHSLPFGRSMPSSEGLSIDQMCQAVQALGVSPNLIRVEDFDTAREYLYAAAISGMSHVLILTDISDSRSAHAVTVVGIETTTGTVTPQSNTGFSSNSVRLRSLFIHDDTRGPYVRAKLRKVRDPKGAGRDRQGRYSIRLTITDGGDRKDWNLSHILMPLHGKIRLSFPELRLVADKLMKSVESFRVAEFDTETATLNRTIFFESVVLRAPIYVEELFLGPRRLSIDKAQRMRAKLSLSRYVGVVRLAASYFGSFDVLVDTTSTTRNITCLAVIVRERTSSRAERIGRLLAGEYECRYIA